MAMMHYNERLWYEAELHRRIATDGGMAFQDLFSDLMEAAYPGDFERIRPRGNLGDGKCDGRLVSDGTIFQCYAPRSLDVRKLQEKVDEDFDGARAEWPDMKRWVLVHNDLDGLDKLTTRQFDEKRRASGIVIEPWGTKRLIQVLHTLTPDDASSLLRVARPAQKDVFLAYKDLEPIIEHLRTRVTGAPTPDLRPPHLVAKLDRNGLNDLVRENIHQGVRRSSLVLNFFRDADDEELGDGISVAMVAEYQRMRKRVDDPNEIFDRLELFVGGSELRGAAHRVAVHALLAYFFERCDIFERVEEGTDDPADEASGA